MARTIVILGANFTGVPIAHYLLKHTAAKVKGGLKVILVSPNTHLYWHLAAPRAIMPDVLSDDELFLPIASKFAKYPAEQFEFIIGKAHEVVPGSKSVVIRSNDGGEQTINYDDLIIATGSTYTKGLPIKNLNSTEETKAALHEFSKKVGAAKSIVVAGGGPTAVEIVGELGTEYGAKGKKQITMIVNDELPLPAILTKEVRSTTKKELENLGVKVIVGTKVTGSSEQGGKTVIQISGPNGKPTTIKADVFIPAFGVEPNTSFLPREMLDAAGFVNTTTYLRAEGHRNIYVVGDASNLQLPKGVTAEQQLIHLVKILDAELLGQEVPEYKIDEKIQWGVSIGKNRGIGQMGTWKVWSFMIWYFKSRDLGLHMAKGFVEGSRTVLQKKW